MEESLNGINIVELVQTGFHGAAIAVLLFSAYLLRDYSQRVLTIEKGKQDFRVVEGVRKLIVFYMVISGVFFFSGVAAQMYTGAASRDASSKVIPGVAGLQNYSNLKPTIYKGGLYLELEPGEAIDIRNGGDLIFSVERLTNELDENKKKMAIHRATFTRLGGEEAGL